MLLNLTDSSPLISQPLRWIVPAQFLDQVTRVPCDIPGELDGVDALQNDVVRPHRIRASERRSSGQQFKHEDTQGPVVRTDVVASVQDHLRGNVFYSGIGKIDYQK